MGGFVAAGEPVATRNNWGRTLDVVFRDTGVGRGATTAMKVDIFWGYKVSYCVYVLFFT